MTTAEITVHPTSQQHVLAKIITSSGRVYACSWAEPFPRSANDVLRAWKEDRRNFLPYNETTGSFCR